MATILYLGEDNSASTTAHRANALKRLGHTVISLNPARFISGFTGSNWLGPLHYRTGYHFLQGQMVKWTKQLLGTIKKPDLVWVNSGELLGEDCLRVLKQYGCPVILYNNDDPTGNRDGRRFSSLLEALPYYDLCAVRREVNIREYHSRGARRVMFVWCSYDEKEHQPFPHLIEIPNTFRSEVAFIGTFIPYEKRDKFLVELINNGLPLSIWGDRWNKSPYYSRLKKHWHGKAIYGRDYVAGIQGAKICLGFLSKQNRDLHTRRSFEIPYAGGLLCAERTAEHQYLYKEGEEAVFWSDAEECASLCNQLLLSERRRERIRLAGMQRVRSLQAGNEDICRAIVSAALSPDSVRTVSSVYPVYEYQ